MGVFVVITASKLVFYQQDKGSKLHVHRHRLEDEMSYWFPMNHLCGTGGRLCARPPPHTHTCITSIHMPHLLFAALAIPQLSRRVWRRTGPCNVSRLHWVHLGASMKPALCLPQSESLSHWRGAKSELVDGINGKNKVTWRHHGRTHGVFLKSSERLLTKIIVWIPRFSWLTYGLHVTYVNEYIHAGLLRLILIFESFKQGLPSGKVLW